MGDKTTAEKATRIATLKTDLGQIKQIIQNNEGNWTKKEKNVAKWAFCMTKYMQDSSETVYGMALMGCRADEIVKTLEDLIPRLEASLNEPEQ